MGFDIGPIPWTAIIKYGYEHELDKDNRETLYEVITTMDNAFVDWVRSKRPKPGGVNG